MTQQDIYVLTLVHIVIRESERDCSIQLDLNWLFKIIASFQEAFVSFCQSSVKSRFRKEIQSNELKKKMFNRVSLETRFQLLFQDYFFLMMAGHIGLVFLPLSLIGIFIVLSFFSSFSSQNICTGNSPYSSKQPHLLLTSEDDLNESFTLQ